MILSIELIKISYLFAKIDKDFIIVGAQKDIKKWKTTKRIDSFKEIFKTKENK